jgi:hypothetical protein
MEVSTPERRSVPPSARVPFRPSPTPPVQTAAVPASARTPTDLGFPAVPAPAAPVADTSETPRATLVQRDSSAPRAARRRRGPIVPDQARKELQDADGRDGILDLFFDYARQYFDYSAIFVVHSDIAEGRDAYGDGASRDRVQAIGVPLDLPSVLASARDACAAVKVEPNQDGLDPVLLGDLERKTRGEVLVVPIVVRTRCVALFYGDSGDDGVDVTASRDVAAFGLLVGQRFEKMIVRKKLEGYRPGSAPAPSLAGGANVPAKPGSRAALPPQTRTVPIPRSVDPEIESNTSPEFPLETPTPAFALETSTPAFALETPTPAFTSPRIDDLGEPPPSSSPPSPPHIVPESELPPPPNAFVVRRPSGPPIPREEPIGDVPAIPPPHPPPSAPSVASDSAPPSASFAVAPHRPPLSRADESPALPSVIVDVDETAGALVDRVVATGSDEAAESELIRQGQKAMPAIMSRFPGPTVVDRARVEDGSLRAAECGPVLRLIAGQRRAALPFILPLVGDGDPLRRYWATFLLTELAYPEVVDPLVPRLFDPDPSVRKVARLAARALGEVAPEALMDRLVRFYRDPSLSHDRRIEMIETLGELRERLAVPLLIDALNDELEEVAAAARRALMTVTRQDLGRDSKKWQTWWAQNGGRHRIEWLIDALMHEVPAIRRAAGDELKTLTKEYFGYYDDLPRKEREKAHQRYREWWANEGRLRFQRR